MRMLETEHSVVLLSGGIDSTTALYWAYQRFRHLSALTFDYKQRHSIEIKMAKKIARKLKIPQEILKVDLAQIGGSSLTDPKLSLPEFSNENEIGPQPPSTYVPFRNGILLAFAAAWAEVHEAKALVCGFNIIDSPNYPDTRENFIHAMEKAINTGTRAAFTGKKMHLVVPFVNKKKSDIIRLGLSLGADYSYSISCYKGTEFPCQTCSSCLHREKAWKEVGLPDPLIERLQSEKRQ